MILIELIQKAVREVASALFWLITARDCEHCIYGERKCHWHGCGFYTECTLPYANEDECKDSITRVAFVRKKLKGGGENETI